MGRVLAHFSCRTAESATICKQQKVIGRSGSTFLRTPLCGGIGGGQPVKKVPGGIVPYCCLIVVPLFFSSAPLFFLRRTISRSGFFSQAIPSTLCSARADPPPAPLIVFSLLFTIALPSLAAPQRCCRHSSAESATICKRPVALMRRSRVRQDASRMRCSAKRCTADPGTKSSPVAPGPRVRSAPLRAALRPGNSDSATICKQQNVVGWFRPHYSCSRGSSCGGASSAARHFCSNDVKQPARCLSATCRTTVRRRACIFPDIYRPAPLTRPTASSRLGSSDLCPPSCVV
jgi:hypothetical protein